MQIDPPGQQDGGVCKAAHARQHEVVRLGQEAKIFADRRAVNGHTVRVLQRLQLCEARVAQLVMRCGVGHNINLRASLRCEKRKAWQCFLGRYLEKSTVANDHAQVGAWCLHI